MGGCDSAAAGKEREQVERMREGSRWRAGRVGGNKVGRERVDLTSTP